MLYFIPFSKFYCSTYYFLRKKKHDQIFSEKKILYSCNFSSFVYQSSLNSKRILYVCNVFLTMNMDCYQLFDIIKPKYFSQTKMSLEKRKKYFFSFYMSKN